MYHPMPDPVGAFCTQIQFESARENHDDPEQHGKREISAARLEKDDDAHDEENNTEQHGEPANCRWSVGIDRHHKFYLP